MPAPDTSRRRTVWPTSCGVLVSDGPQVLLGHAAMSRLWDIPKGIAEPGETHAEAAARELGEETGIAAAPASLIPLGLHAYLRGKDLALFGRIVPAMPDPAGLACRTRVRLRDGRWVPELDAYAALPWEAALERTGRNLARVLRGLRAGGSWPFG